jgi:SPP1 gp7 family putative phage head morphogenesis protein
MTTDPMGSQPQAVQEPAPMAEPAVKPKPKRTTKKESESRSLKARTRAMEAALPMFNDIANRTTRKECKAVRALLKHLPDTETFCRKVEEFYDKHQEHIRDAYTPALQSLAQSIRHAVTDELHREADMPSNLVALYTPQMCIRHCNRSKDLIADTLKTANPDDLAKALEDRLGHIQDHQPQATAQHETNQAGNYFTRETYRCSGVTSVQWVSAGCSPECNDLDGKKVSLDTPFTQDPLRNHPPYREGCRCGIIAD